jgi:TonB-linked SusC/RagA family outer membrane protein
MKKSKLLLWVFIGFMQTAFAQNIIISGTVTDPSGEPIPGVNVVIEGTQDGTSTDFDGKYTLATNNGDVLVFSALGYETVKKKVTGPGTINVVLKEGASQLDKVVITAMGIKKKEKALGYASQQVKVDDMKQINQNALANIQGQVSGVQISQSSGAVGGGVDILIRGVKSLDASVSNQPLIVVDGLRISNDIIAGNVLPSTGSNAPSSSEQFSFSNRAIDLNPDDIASITVLKGAAASALYGIDAANGAIIITTKKGKKGTAPQYTLSTKFTYSDVNKYVELQDKWREGRYGVSKITQDPNNPNVNPVQVNGYGEDKGYWLINGATYSFHTWGPEYGDDPTMVFHDIYRDFFVQGASNNVNLSVRGGQEKFGYYLSLGRNTSTGVVPNTFFNKTNIRIRADYQLNEKLNFEVSSSYTNSTGQLPNNGDKSIMSSLSYWSPSVDVNDYLLPNGRQKNYTPYWIDNSRYFAEKSNLKTDVDRVITGASVKWNPTNKINVNYRVSLDNYVDTRNRFVPADLDVGTQVQGFIVNQNIRFNSFNSTLLASYNMDLNEDLNLKFIGGNEITKQDRYSERVLGETLIVPDYNNISNTQNVYPSSYRIGKNRVGVFGEIDLSYKDKLFINVTGRNDWSSTLPEQNRSFFYPSVNASYVFTDLIDKESKFLSFGKLRFSWANVGKDAPEGILGTNWYLTQVPQNPSGNTGAVYPSTTEGDLNLKPENQRTNEYGVDLRFLGNRFRIDYTYYDNLNTDLIARIPVSQTSGKTLLITNAGSISNKGHEVLVSAKWFNKPDFKWSTTINWSTNEGKVEDLPEGVSQIIYANSGYAGVVSMVKEGDAPGTLYGYKWNYNENGDRIIYSDGMPRINTSEKVIVGQAFPDWVGSLQNSFSFKNFHFGFLLEYKKGGDAYDAGQRNSIRDGTIKITETRYEYVVLDGVIDDGNGGWQPNNIPAYIDENYYRSSTRYNRASEILVQDASWVKLRNISLAYTFPSKILKGTFIKNLQLNVSGANFLLWTPFRGFDPEGSQYSAGSNTYGFTGLNIPLTQSYSFGVKVGF